ncbi:MAG TPA: hypothetical protein VJZ49_01755 [Syntrophales bacterium]|nr:hypothetical protein [Syntrophales bacterium]
MPMENRERAKLFIVIGLAVIFILVGYFRFFHGKGVSPVQPNVVAGTAGPIAVPAIDLKGVRPAAGLPENVSALHAPLRNIFAPAGNTSVPESAHGEAVGAPQKLLPALQLTGIIIGGKRPLAIINGRFLRQGEAIEGFQVLSIARNQVILSADGRKVVLNVLDGKVK